MDFPLVHILMLPQNRDMNKSTNFSGQTIIKQLLKLLPYYIVSRTVSKHGSDRYYKWFKTYDHLAMMLYATLGGVSSLRELSTILPACEGRIGHLNLKYFLKRSTLSDANKNLSGEVFSNIYYLLFERYRSFLSDSSRLSLPLKHLKIVDSFLAIF